MAGLTCQISGHSQGSRRYIGRDAPQRVAALDGIGPGRVGHHDRGRGRGGFLDGRRAPLASRASAASIAFSGAAGASHRGGGRGGFLGGRQPPCWGKNWHPAVRVRMARPPARPQATNRLIKKHLPLLPHRKARHEQRATAAANACYKLSGHPLPKGASGLCTPSRPPGRFQALTWR